MTMSCSLLTPQLLSSIQMTESDDILGHPDPLAIPFHLMPSHLSSSESLLEFDAETFLDPDFSTDLVDDKEGLIITEVSLQNQIGPEQGRELYEVHVEGLSKDCTIQTRHYPHL